MEKYILAISGIESANINCFLSKKRAFNAFIKAKSGLFYDNTKSIQLNKSIIKNNKIYNFTIKTITK